MYFFLPIWAIAILAILQLLLLAIAAASFAAAWFFWQLDGGEF